MVPVKTSTRLALQLLALCCSILYCRCLLQWFLQIEGAEAVGLAVPLYNYDDIYDPFYNQLV